MKIEKNCKYLVHYSLDGSIRLSEVDKDTSMEYVMQSGRFKEVTLETLTELLYELQSKIETVTEGKT